MTAADLNTHLRDNENALREGGLALTSQAAGDLLYASSATQLARLAGSSGKFLKSNGTAAPTLVSLAAFPYTVTLTEVANTVTETTFLSFTVPANEMADGDVIDVPWAQTEQDTSGLGGSTTLTFKGYWGTTLIGTIGSHALNDTLTRRHFAQVRLQRIGADLWLSTPVVIAQGPFDPMNVIYSLQGGSSSESALILAAAGFAADKLVELKMTLSRANANVKYTPKGARVVRYGA